MTEKYYLNDILENEKNMAVNMAIALNEASNDSLYNEFFKMFSNISKEAKLLFNIAYNNSWYTLEEAQKDKITQEKTKLTDELSIEEDY